MERNRAESGHLVTFDERTETWYIETRRPQRLALNRDSIEEIVRIYNSIHTGRQLLLQEERIVRRMEDQNLRLTHTVRDLYLALDSKRRSEIGPRIASAIARLAAVVRRPPAAR